MVKIRTLLSFLDRKYRVACWWPGDPDEVIIGTILIHQTRWKNVERGISELHRRGMCQISTLASSPTSRIEEAIRCTGFFRKKARLLKNLSRVIMSRFGGVPGMVDLPQDDLRNTLLSIKGVGEETTDSILCFALGKCSFILDRYTARICRCAGVSVGGRALKSMIESVLPHDFTAYCQAHAHFVEYAKDWCGKKRCKECTIATFRG